MDTCRSNTPLQLQIWLCLVIHTAPPVHVVKILGSPEGRSFIHVPLSAGCVTRRKKVRTILTREVIFHIGTSSPAFKKKKEDPSLPQQGCTNHHLQRMGNCHNLQLLFPNKLRFKTSSRFLLKPHKSFPSPRLSRCACSLLQFAHPKLQFSAIPKESHFAGKNKWLFYFWSWHYVVSEVGSKGDGSEQLVRSPLEPPALCTPRSAASPFGLVDLCGAELLPLGWALWLHLGSI